MAEPLILPTQKSSTKKRREAKGKERERAREQVAAASGSAAGPSKHKSKAKQEPTESWDCIPIARSEVSSVPPVWSKDGRFYFTAAGTSVFVHSSTGPNFERLSTLSSTDPNGHRKTINALLVHPTNALQIITASDDGTVKVWDWVEGRLVRTIVAAQNGHVKQICLGEHNGVWWIYANISTVKSKSGKHSNTDPTNLSHKVVRMPISGHAKEGDTAPIVQQFGKLRAPPAALFLSPRSNYLVSLAGTKVYVYRLPKDVAADGSWRPQCVKFVSDEIFTCGAFAPHRRSRSGAEQEEWFATGDVKGVVRLWPALAPALRRLDAGAGQAQQNDTEKRLETTSLHWHAHAVAAIAFTTAGAQILSVGEESVLVQWHLASGNREYIPRLGGRPILSVAVRPGARGVQDEFWMGFADGSMMRVGAVTGAVSPVGQDVRLDPLRPTSKRAYPLAVHPVSKALVVPSSHPSTLQFIDPLESSVLFDLEVAPSNRVSRRDEKELEPVAVEMVAFSAVRDGRSEWMATVEGRPADETEGGGLVRTLKFWRWNGDRYVINTQYPRPHGTEDLTALAFGETGTEPFVVTAASSGSVKLWHVRQAKKSEQGKTSSKKPEIAELYWSLRSTFNYRALPVHAGGFSPDGSLVVLVHGPVITLWNAATNVFVRALESPVDARKLAFAGPEGRYIVTAARIGVAVWDVLSCELVATLPNQAADMLVGLRSGILAGRVVPQKGTEAKSKTEVTILAPNGAAGRTVTLAVELSALASLPSSAVHLVGIASSGEIYRFGELQKACAPTKRAINADAPRRATSIWQEMFGRDAFLDELAPPPEKEEAAVSALQRAAAGRPEAVFEGASHTLPPVGLLFDAFMDELLAPRPEGHEETMDVDEEEAVTFEAVVAPDAVRSVTDREVEDLETFFRNLKMGAKSKPKPLPKAVKKPNGLPNGSSHGRTVSTPVKPTKPKSKSVPGTPGTPATPEMVDGKRSKKRKAPRHSEL
ncbi:WD40 repeat-like protein [Cutaneotrichosporon oleaginosum]|uniref:WD40 repeat-like protein n=1 Tax=Cutaneotrichosporon oleaginosum TaxID=879819 RepID=A0A0J0XQD8_9TREE|nr:WD40 repeat-like protein [Cutaneotrichosporon oleaginosum]KLT43330.1 WD40 repeat-like protein [Cutaneotrichosporon oleaginosum]TXT14408.1 hypothetical protein COLE_00601 [Cutaneotrichosporon oleaginosum]